MSNFIDAVMKEELKRSRKAAKELKKHWKEIQNIENSEQRMKAINKVAGYELCVSRPARVGAFFN
jgi:uncharacterized protein Yka (UPF0111/DUF47 family)